MDQNNHNFSTEIEEAEVEETEIEENFEELLNQSKSEPVRLNPGQMIEATVTKISKEYIFIDFGGKSEGYLHANEVMDDEGNISIKEGDTINAFFLSSRNNEMLFATRLKGDTTGNKYLEEAYQNHIPIEGFVEKEIKGGFEVKIGGNTRAFCPFSQMGMHRVENAEDFVGGHMTFKIIEYGERGRNIIVSNRVILEEELREQMDALKGSLKEGMTVSGEILSIKNFGAFVDIGGIEGLIPVSEISWGRVDDINSSLKVGQKVDVVIKKLDWENNKFSFSLKEVLPDPWDNIALKYPEGSSHKGKVVRLATFGAFVNLEPGIDGLIHISELGKDKKIRHPHEVLEQGQNIEVKITRVDADGKRLSLKMTAEEQDLEDEDYYKKHLLERGNKTSGSFGTLGDMLKAKMEKS
ncbi:MAG TPA: 30S ribosomal protein S1 [Desulfobacteraceae bacterium]|nr:30S ribosomal protein S1 [Desulfobacteraceae bacterium]HPJ66773.1 30S ribosomal protein S1 [Desulfobacteraceae bacterium]HPQ26983.1 30S ribosomal protein S1 [Desulfobacteraceae bacterium]